MGERPQFLSHPEECGERLAASARPFLLLLLNHGFLWPFVCPVFSSFSFLICGVYQRCPVKFLPILQDYKKDHLSQHEECPQKGHVSGTGQEGPERDKCHHDGNSTGFLYFSVTTRSGKGAKLYEQVWSSSKFCGILYHKLSELPPRNFY